MTFTEYLLKVVGQVVEIPHYRTGQAYFNTLMDCKPEMAYFLKGTVLDPYYDDKNVPAFLAYVGEHWEKYP